MSYNPTPLDGSGNVKVNLETPLPTGTNALGSVSVSNLPGTQPVSGTIAISTLPALPTGTNSIGAVTITGTLADNLTQVGGSTITLGSKTSANSLPVVVASDQAALPVTGTFFQTTQPVSASTLPLPTGASTSAKQPALGVAGTASTDVITVQGIASGTPQPISGTVSVTGTVPVSGTFFQTTQPVSGSVTATVSGTVPVSGTFYQTTQPVSGTFYQATQPVSGTVAISGTLADNLTQVGGTSITLGSKVSASSLPVVIASDQGAVPISGTITVGTLPALPSGSNTIGSVTQATGSNLHTVVDSGTITTVSAVTAITNALPSGTNSIGAVTQATGTNLHTVVDSGTITTVSAVTAITNALPSGTNTLGSVKVTDGTNLMPTGDAVARAIFVKNTDGTNIASVKAASTLPLATDTALVVAISPNQTGMLAVTTTDSDQLISGSITTQNLNPTSGAATAASTVACLQMGGDASAGIQVTGTYTGALTPQVSVDGSNWVAMSATALLNINTNVFSATIASAAVGIYQVDVAGFKLFRITALAAVTGTAVVTIEISSGGSMFALDAPIPTGTNSIGNLGTVATVSTVTAVTTVATVTNITNAVQQAPSTTGGLSSTTLISAASTNATSVKASAGQLYAIQAFNLNAAPRYLKIYNKASAPTVGTDTPVATYLIPANGAGFIIDIPFGMTLSTGLAFAITGGITVADTTAILISEVSVNIQYK
jgi:hypothetical protein